MQQHIQLRVLGKIRIGLAVFAAGRPAKPPGRMAVSFFQQSRRTLQRSEPRLGQSKQNAVAFINHRAGHAETSVPGIGHCDRTTRHPFRNALRELRFGRVVLAVHRPNCRRQHATALQFVSDQQQSHCRVIIHRVTMVV